MSMSWSRLRIARGRTMANAPTTRRCHGEDGNTTFRAGRGAAAGGGCTRAGAGGGVGFWTVATTGGGAGCGFFAAVATLFRAFATLGDLDGALATTLGRVGCGFAAIVAVAGGGSTVAICGAGAGRSDLPTPMAVLPPA